MWGVVPVEDTQWVLVFVVDLISFIFLLLARKHFCILIIIQVIWKQFHDFSQSTGFLSNFDFLFLKQRLVFCIILLEVSCSHCKMIELLQATLYNMLAFVRIESFWSFTLVTMAWSYLNLVKYCKSLKYLEIVMGKENQIFNLYISELKFSTFNSIEMATRYLNLSKKKDFVRVWVGTFLSLPFLKFYLLWMKAQTFLKKKVFTWLC